MDDAHALKNIPRLLSHTQTRRSRASLSLSLSLFCYLLLLVCLHTYKQRREPVRAWRGRSPPFLSHTLSLLMCARLSHFVSSLRARNAMHTKHTSFSCILSSPSKRLRAIFDDDVLLLAKKNTTHTTRGFSLLLITCGFSLLIKTCNNALCDQLPQPG